MLSKCFNSYCSTHFVGAKEHIQKEWLFLNERAKKKQEKTKEDFEIEQDPYVSLVEYLDGIREERKFDVSADSNPTEWLTELLEIVGFPKLVTMNFVEGQLPDIIPHFAPSEWIESYLDYLMIQVDPTWLSSPYVPFSNKKTNEWFEPPKRYKKIPARRTKFLQYNCNDKSQVTQAWTRISERNPIKGEIVYFHGVRRFRPERNLDTQPETEDERSAHCDRKMNRIRQMVTDRVNIDISHKKNDFADSGKGFFLHVGGERGFRLAVNWALTNGIIGAVFVFSFTPEQDDSWRGNSVLIDGINYYGISMHGGHIPQPIKTCFRDGNNLEWKKIWELTITRYRIDRNAVYNESIFNFETTFDGFINILDHAPFIQGLMMSKISQNRNLTYTVTPMEYETTTPSEDKPIQLCIKDDNGLVPIFDMHLDAVIFFQQSLRPQRTQQQTLSRNTP